MIECPNCGGYNVMHHDVFADEFPFYFCRDCNDSFYDDQADDQIDEDGFQPSPPFADAPGVSYRDYHPRGIEY